MDFLPGWSAATWTLLVLFFTLFIMVRLAGERPISTGPKNGIKHDWGSSPLKMPLTDGHFRVYE